MAKGPAVSMTREANVLAAYKLLSEDASFVKNIYRRLKLSYYQYEVSSVCYMLQVGSIVLGCSLGCSHQWWEKLLVNLTVLGVIVLIAYGAFNQVAKIHTLFTSITA